MERSIWEKESFFAPQDVIIAGSGLVGLWSAFYLKKRSPSLRVTILERGILPSGASIRNAGFAGFGSPGELSSDAQLMGSERMVELVEMRLKGLRRIRKHFGRVADLDPCGGYELYEGRDLDRVQLQDQIDYLNTLLRPVTRTRQTFRLANEEIARLGFEQTQFLVRNDLEGTLHSGRLMQALLHRVQGMGVTVITGMEITGFEEGGNGFEVRTRSGFSLTARQVLVCTNAFARDLLPDADVVPARGQVLVTSPIPELDWKGAFHADAGYFYFRNLGNRVLLGGARHRAFEAEATTEALTSPFIQQELEKYLDQVILPHYRGQYTIEHRWAGIMGMGRDKFPELKQVRPGMFSLVNTGGLGVSLSPMAGRQAARTLLS